MALDLASVADGSLALRDGARVVAAIAPKTPARLRGAATVKEVAVEGRRVAVVRVPGKDKPTTEVWLGLLDSGAARVLWTGMIGAQDADGETSLVLVVDGSGITLYESAGRVTQCDGTPLRIAPRRFDFEAAAFRAAPVPLPPLAAQKLVARRGAARARRPRITFSFTSASAPPAESSGEDARALVAPLSLSDGDLETSWVEKGGARGTGGVLTARAAGGGFAVSELHIVPGDVHSAEAFAAHGRARTLALVLGPQPEQRFEVTLEDAGGDRRRPFVVTLPRPVVSSCVSLQAREVVPGRTGASTVAWTEVTVFTDLDGSEGTARLVQDLSGPSCAARLGDVATLGPAAGAQLVNALVNLPPGGGPGRGCLLEALPRLRPEQPVDGETATAFTKALPRILPTLGPDEELALAGVVRRLPSPPVNELAAVLQAEKTAGKADEGADEATRMRAARALFALPGEEPRRRLVRALGTGAPALRAELRRLVAATPGAVARLGEALGTSAPDDVALRADLAAALGEAARAQGGSPEASALLRDLALQPQADFLIRARAVQALGALGARKDEAALAALGDLARKSEDPPLRLLATRGLGAAGRAQTARVAPGLRAAVADRDPAVRAAAAEALGALADGGANELLIGAAKQEPWPMVRRAEVEALGRLCGPGAGDLLARAVERNDLETPDIRQSALRGLFACRDERALSLGLEVLERETETPPMRTEAALCLGRTGRRELAGDLAGNLRRLLVEAENDLGLEGTTLATLQAMAGLGGSEALDAALAMRTDRRPGFRRAAAQALGQLCSTADPARAGAALREAMRDADESVAMAARAALRRCPGGATGAPAAATNRKARP